MRETDSTESAPRAVGPYSQSVRAGSFLFISGQLGIDAATGKLVSSDVEQQAERALKNIGSILRAAGAGFDRVVKTTIFLSDMSTFERVNAVYSRFFVENLPARSTVQVAALPRGALVEIEAIAYIA